MLHHYGYVIERILFWIRKTCGAINRSSTKFSDCLKEVTGKQCARKVTGSRDYVIRILVNGILHHEFSMTKAMETAAADEIKRMHRFLGVLDTMITVAPLLGILGTVTGIITAFNLWGQAASSSPMATAGIAEALITTAAGLFIAIPSIIPLNYFNSRAEDAALNIEKYATSLEIVYDKLTQAQKQE